MTETPKGQHGGYRPGSGRRPIDGEPRPKITVTLPLHLRDRLDAWAAREGVTRSDAVIRALEAFLIN